MKARVAKRIRYPCSPGRKRCPLDIGVLKGDARVVGKPLNGPPGEYDRKVEIEEIHYKIHETIQWNSLS